MIVEYTLKSEQTIEMLFVKTVSFNHLNDLVKVCYVEEGTERELMLRLCDVAWFKIKCDEDGNGDNDEQ